MRNFVPFLLVVAASALGCSEDPASLNLDAGAARDGGTPSTGDAGRDAGGRDAGKDAGSDEEEEGATAAATLAPKSSNKTLSGTATFVEDEDGVTLTLLVEGAPPGEHGAHIHETGDCSAADATSAGGHWNPTDSVHGLPDGEESHLGDLGNLVVDDDGNGELTLSKADWKIGDDSDFDVVGKAVVIHANVDDGETDPTGASGGRIGCGVIEAE